MFIGLPLIALPLIAADPLPYTVDLPPTNEAPLDAALNDASSLVRLRDTAPVGPFALLTRARADKSRLETALGSFGRYDAAVAIRIDGRDIDDPDLPAALEAAAGPVAVAIAITPGPLFRIGRITLVPPPGIIDPGSQAIARAALQLARGDPARAADILAAQSRMLDALRSQGHALARVETPAATLDPANHTLDIAYPIDAGPAVNLGPIAIAGAPGVDDAYVRRRLLIHQGDRQDLASVGVFSTVQAKAATTLDPQGDIPIAIDLTERPRHVVGATAAYSTDLGASAGLTWRHRNLFGAAEQLDLGAAVTELGGNATRRPGYNITAALMKPDVFVRDQSVTVSLQAVKESLDAYDRQAILGGVQVNRKLAPGFLGPGLVATAGVQGQQSRITQEGVTRDYTLLGVPIGLTYDTTGPEGLFEPIGGIKASVIATPTVSFGGGGQFTIIQATASTYLNLAAPGRSVIALRAALGSIQGAAIFSVPPDQRLYAGGSATVRGYKYQSVGPKFPSGRPTGGSALAAATVEFRQRFGESFGAAIFADAGQVDAAGSPFGGQVRAGAGAGARDYTPIGPIRLDVALPLNKQRGDDAFELYIGIGQVF
jgi:translocation and assembly module TamA